MTSTLDKKLFEMSASPDDGLLSSILIRIEKEKKRIEKRNLTLFSLGSILSLGVLAPSAISLFHNFVEGGFYDFLSLTLSENTSLALYWKELLLSLFESLPTLGLISFLSGTAFFTWSFAKAATGARKLLLVA